MLGFCLSLLGIGKNIMGWLSAAFGWLFKRWYRVAIAALCIAVMVLSLVNISLRGRLTRMTERYTVEASAHITTKVNYANAQKVAADMNRHQVEVIKQKYDAIAERTESDYEKRLADNRANLAKFMRTQAAARAAQGTGTSGTASMPSEVVQDTAQAEFLIRADDLEIAADNYSQLVSLIEWAKQIGEVKPNE